MELRICGRSLGVGVAIGASVLGLAWYGTTLNARASITPALIAAARCDAAGLVAITFPDASQFTCVPAQQIPPTSREEAARRKRVQP
jgi:hypothetical protein